MIWLPTVGAVSLAGVTVFERFFLKKKNFPVKTYQVLEFLAIVIAIIPFLFFFWNIDASVFQLKNILILLSVVVLAVVANLFTFYSMKGEKVNNLEPALSLQSLFVVLLAIVFSFIFGQNLYERKLHVVIPALIAGVVLVFMHVKKHHLNFNKYFIAAIVGSFFFGLELVISQLILNLYSPITFYFIRCLGILIISIIILRPNISAGFEGTAKWNLLLIGFLCVVNRFAVYFGYTHIGVISTSLILMLGPALTFLFAWIFLKEKISWKNIVAVAVIMACVVYASIA